MKQGLGGKPVSSRPATQQVLTADGLSQARGMGKRERVQCEEWPD